MPRIAFLGPAGTYSETATQQLFAGVSGVEFVPCETLDDVVAAVERGAADHGVLPIENSTEGSVNRTLDLLVKTPLLIQHELVLPIHHQLLSKARGTSEITDVWAHPQALAQCRLWLARHLPHAEQHAARSNGEAARTAALHGTAAAIAGDTAAELYNLRVLAPNIEDQAHNTTRFVSIGKQPSRRSGRDKTSLVCSLHNQAGSLHGLLGIFARHGINLAKLEPRPLPDTAWDYLFYIDCEGHHADVPVAAALGEVAEYAVWYKPLGSYPAAPPLKVPRHEARR